MLLGIQPEVWTCTQDQMADYTTPQGSEQKPKCVRPSSQACSSPMTQQLPHTLNKIYSVLWTDSLRPAISPKRTNVLGQDVNTLTVITINNYKLEVVHQFTYHGSTISDNLSLNAEINKHIGKFETTPLASGRTPSWPLQRRWQCTTLV